MIKITGNNVNELFINISKEMVNNSHENSPRGLKTWELNDAWLEIEDTEDPIVSLESRKLDNDYLVKEMRWYYSGSLYAKDISEYASMWDKLKDSNGTINSNYGFLTMVQKWAGKSQLEWCVDSLIKDPNTRQAVMNYNQPIHKYNDVKDFVCTISQTFIKRDGKLETIVLMRSNDLVYGLSYDIPWFSAMHKKVSELTGIPLGKYNHYDTSLHVYERHFNMVKEMSKEKI